MMDILGFLKDELVSPIKEAKWWKDVATGKKDFSLSSHNEIRAPQYQKIFGDTWVGNNPDKAALAVIGSIFGGAALAGAGGAGAAGGAAGGTGLSAGSGGMGLTAGAGGTGAGMGGALGSGISGGGLLGAGSAGTGSAAGAGGLLTQAQPWLNAANTGMSVAGQAGLLGGRNSQQAQAAPVQQRPLDLSGVLASGNQRQQDEIQEQLRRRQLMAQYAQNAMGGRFNG